MKLHEKIMGKNRENIPNWAFKLMTFIMKMMDVFGNHSNNNFKRLGIQKNQIVVDYGCGPARYIKNISQIVGENGKLYAVDIHPMAIRKVQEKIKKQKLQNVESVLSKGYNSSIKNNVADVVLALDMFHMIQDHHALLKEFSRILKPKGFVIIEDGHQSRIETKAKVVDGGYFKVIAENEHHLKCKLI
ncbi:MAG: class I SAM-dependent methyltransferase [Bacteroidota bacterium]|nr:class I SAM-dependent methyltransferase [Bacteroidota bacterium]